MKGRMHLFLSLLSLLVITLPLGSHYPWSVWVWVYAGVLVGSLAPDVDAPDAAIFHLRMLPRLLRVPLALFAYLLRYLVYLPLSFLFWIVLSRQYRHEHRGLLHTPVGVFLATLLISGYACILIFLIHPASVTPLPLFTGSFLAGCILHLLQDSCTPSGIAWAFPLHPNRVRGTIRTNSRGDPRPLLYAGVLLGCLAVLYLLPPYPFPPSWLTAIAMLIAAWLLFLYLARATRGEPNVY